MDLGIGLEDVLQGRCILERGAPLRIVQGDMHRDDERSAVRDGCEVLLEPGELVGDDAPVVLARIAGVALLVRCGRLVRALHIVQDHVMDLADVEGIIGRADVFLEILHGIVVAHIVHAVVVVADGMVHRHALDGGRIGQVLYY